MFDPEYRLKQIDAQIKQLEEEKKRIENTILHAHTQASKQYAIWYAQSRFDEFMPASGSPKKFTVKVVYSSLQEAKQVAEHLSRQTPGMIFRVYPVNHNYEINGKLLFGVEYDECVEYASKHVTSKDAYAARDQYRYFYQQCKINKAKRSLRK